MVPDFLLRFYFSFWLLSPRDDEKVNNDDDDDDANGGIIKVFVFANKVCKLVEVNLYGFSIFETFYLEN